MKSIKTLFILFVFATHMGCSKDSVCDPGETQSCVCADGSGAQVCDSSGESWGACVCGDSDPDAGDSDARANNTTADTSIDVSSDIGRDVERDARRDMSSDSAVEDMAPCQYPAGPYGITEGEVVDPALEWQGFLESDSLFAPASAEVLFDCDGRFGTNAILLVLTQLGVPPDEDTARDISANAANWGRLGIRTWFMVVNPNTEVEDLRVLRNDFALEDVGLFLDPNAMLAGPAFSTPLYLLVDPRTMEIVSKTTGYSGDYSAVEALAMQN